MNCYFCRQPLNLNYYLARGKFLPVCLQHPLHLIHQWNQLEDDSDESKLELVYSMSRPISFVLSRHPQKNILAIVVEDKKKTPTILFQKDLSTYSPPLDLILSLINRLNNLKAFL